jgi:GNAT superfamily N-acetyltransferase
MSALRRVVVRRATPGDRRSLVTHLKQPGYFINRLNYQASGRGMLLIALHKGKPVGDVFLDLAPAGEEYLELVPGLAGVPLLQHLEVLPAYRSHGIGTKLLRLCERELRSLGHRRMVLGVSPGNEAAINLYLRLGYRWCPDPDIPELTPAVINAWTPDGTRIVAGKEKCYLMVKGLTSENRISAGVFAAVGALAF